MPLHVKIAVNNEVIHRLHIARMEELKSEDQFSEYRVVEGKLEHHEIRYEDGIPFTHQYNQGAKVCVARALVAVLEAELAAMVEPD